MSIEKIISHNIDMFDFLKNSTNNYHLYIECYQLDNGNNDFKYEMKTDVNYPILLSAICKFQNIVRDGRWLISHLLIIKITYKTVFYTNLKVGTIINMRKLYVNTVREYGFSSLFDTYYNLDKQNMCLFDAIKKECYVKTKVIVIQ